MNPDLDWDSVRQAADELDRKIHMGSAELRARWAMAKPRLEGQLAAIEKYLRMLHDELSSELAARPQPH